VRYLSRSEAQVLPWLRTALAQASSLWCFTTALDGSGLALLRDGVVDVLARGGSVRVVVPSAHEADVVREVLGGHENLVVDVAASAPPVNVYAVADAGGAHRAYFGTVSLTKAGLTEGAPGVLLDLRSDDIAATALLRDIESLVDLLAVPRASHVLSDLISPFLDELEARVGASPVRQRTPSVPGTATGLRDLDLLTGGLQTGDLWVVTGRSGAGKSALALGFARSAAVHQMVPTALVQVRDEPTDVLLRILGAEAQVRLVHLRHGVLGDDEWARLARRMGEISEAPMTITATSGGSLVSTARAVLAGPPVQVLVLDDVPGMTAAAFSQLKQLAHMERVCVIAALAHIPERALDAVESEAATSADVVIRVGRERDLSPVSRRAGEADLVVVHHRRGPSTTITVVFEGQYGRFSNLDEDTGTPRDE